MGRIGGEIFAKGPAPGVQPLAHRDEGGLDLRGADCLVRRWTQELLQVLTGAQRLGHIGERGNLGGALRDEVLAMVEQSVLPPSTTARRI